MSEIKLYQVTTRRYTAGFMTHKGKVIDAAPILYWTRGCSIQWVKYQVRLKGGQVRLVPQRRKRQSRKERKK